MCGAGQKRRLGKEKQMPLPLTDFKPPVKRRRGPGFTSFVRPEEVQDVSQHTFVDKLKNIGAGFLLNRGPTGFLPEGADIDIVAGGVGGGSPGGDICAPGFHVAVDKCTGQLVCKKTRRRRKRMLTCGDKADIAFLTGTLGKGQMAQTAISALIAKC